MASNSDDAKAVEHSNLWHPKLTHFVSEVPVHAKFRDKDEHHRNSASKEPLKKGDMGPLKRCCEDQGCNGCTESNKPSTPTPTPTVPTTSPRVSCPKITVQPSERQSHRERHDKDSVSENKHSNNSTYPHSSGALDTRSVSVVESITFGVNDTNNTHGSPHQCRGPSFPVLYPPSYGFCTHTQRQNSPTRPSQIRINYSPSPPTQQAQKRSESSASHHQYLFNYPTTPTTPAFPSSPSFSSSSPPDKWLENMMPSHNIHLYSPPTTAQEAFLRQIANNRPPFEVSYPGNLPHASWLEPFVPNKFHNNLDEALDLNALDVALWCGTDLVGDPRMFWTQPAQAHAQDARHARVHKWSLEEQLMRTQWHPQRFLRRRGGGQGQAEIVGRGRSGGGYVRPPQGQGGYADYGLLDQKDEEHAAARRGHELHGSLSEEEEEIPVPIRDTSARLVDMVVSKEQAEEEGLFLPPVRDKYLVSKCEVKQEPFWRFLLRTVGVETGMFEEKGKDKKK